MIRRSSVDMLDRLVKAARSDRPTTEEFRELGALIEANVRTSAANARRRWRSRIGLMWSVLALGLTVVAAVTVVRTTRPSVPPIVLATEHAASAPAGSVAPAAPAMETAASTTPGASVPVVMSVMALPVAKPKHVPSATLEDGTTETEWLRLAQAALVADPARALALTEIHRARYRRPLLAQERDVIAIEALSRLGRSSEAAARAADFDVRYPQSPYRLRVERSLGAHTETP